MNNYTLDMTKLILILYYREFWHFHIAKSSPSHMYGQYGVYLSRLWNSRNMSVCIWKKWPIEHIQYLQRKHKTNTYLLLLMHVSLDWFLHQPVGGKTKLIYTNTQFCCPLSWSMYTCVCIVLLFILFIFKKKCSGSGKMYMFIYFTKTITFIDTCIKSSSVTSVDMKEYTADWQYVQQTH